jgi:hypothetical protein
VDLDDALPRTADPRVDLEHLRREAERLPADPLLGQPPVLLRRRGVGRQGEGGAHRGHEDRGASRAQGLAREHVGEPRTVVGQADRHVDGDDLEAPRDADEILDVRGDVDRRHTAVVEHDADPASPARVDAEHSSHGHLPLCREFSPR